MVEAQISQVVMDSIHQLLAGKSVKPGFVWTSACAHFGDDHETIGVRMERLLDQLIGHMRTVVVAGIDVVHAGLHRLSQNSNGSINVAWGVPTLPGQPVAWPRSPCG